MSLSLCQGVSTQHLGSVGRVNELLQVNALGTVPGREQMLNAYCYPYC